MKEIEEGEKLRWGYGFCWTNYDRMTYTTALVPFNLLLRWGRELYIWLASPKRSKKEQEIRNRMSRRYSEGYKTGYEDAEKIARRYTIKEVGKALGSGINGLKDLIDKWVKEGYYFDID